MTETERHRWHTCFQLMLQLFDRATWEKDLDKATMAYTYLSRMCSARWGARKEMVDG